MSTTPENSKKNDRQRTIPVPKPVSPKRGTVGSRLRKFGAGSFRLYSLQGKLILPYVLLTVILAAIGIYVITQLVTSSVRERLFNQLYEASRFSNDSFVRTERKQIEDLRLAAYTNGVSEAVLAKDRAAIEALLKPLVANRQMQILTVVDAQSQELLTIGVDPAKKEYYSSSGADLSTEPLVQLVLHKVVDRQGDKHAGLINLPQGWALITSTPVYTPDDQIGGVLLCGTYLDSILAEIKKSILVDVVVVGPAYNLISTTVVEPDETYQPLIDAAKRQPLEGDSQVSDIMLNQREYSSVYSALQVRGEALGWIGVVLPKNFVAAAESTSRNFLSLVFTAGTIAIIIVGYFLAQNIALPILKLRTITQAVASGDLKQTSQLKREDEIGELANAFDVMTLNLRDRTAEAARLYAETLQRNKELAEINERLKATQLQLIQSEKLAAIGQLTAGIVHDVKNPFTVIMGMAEMLSEDDQLDEETRRSLKLIRESAVKGNTIVSDLLKFARQSTPEMKVGDLRETLQAAIRLTNYLTRRYHMVCELPEQAVYLRYDPQQIEQVLINMIHNALQAMPDGGDLRISLKPMDNNIRIEVADSGTGIAPEHLKRIFDPFFTTKKEGEGTGLGLSVSYGIIANHQGTIEVSSTPGQGTTFIILLPRNPEVLGESHP